MIEIDPDVFTYNEAEDMSKETFLVTGDFRSEAVVHALSRAAERFMVVDENGVEYAPDRIDDMYAAGVESPSYVSDPKVSDRGITMYVDCKGVIPDDMARTLRQVLREELDAAAVTARVIAVDVQ